MRVGLSFDDYDKITPKELEYMVEVYNEKIEHEIYLVWLGANLGNARRIPKFKDLLPKKYDKVKNTEVERFKLKDYQIDIHYNRFLKGRGLLLIG